MNHAELTSFVLYVNEDGTVGSEVITKQIPALKEALDKYDDGTFKRVVPVTEAVTEYLIKLQEVINNPK